MSLLLNHIVSVATLVPALQFGQVPNIANVGGAAKEAFQAAADAFDGAAKGGGGGKSSGGKSGSAASKLQGSQGKGPSTMFSKMGERANGAAAANNAPATVKQQVVVGGHKMAISSFGAEETPAASSTASDSTTLSATAENREQSILRFLGSSTEMFYRGVLFVVGIAFAWCVVSRVKAKMTDFSTGRPSLSRSRIVRR